MREAHLKRKTPRVRKEPKLNSHSARLEKLVEERTRDLRRNEEKLRSIFAASPDAITVTDLKGNIVDCNQAALKMCRAKSKKDLVGKNALEFFAKKDRQNAAKNFIKILEQGSIRNVEYTLLTKNGIEYPVELSVSVVRDASGKSTSFVAIIKEIAERKRVEEALREDERKHYEETLSALNACGGKLNSAKSLREVYELTLNATELTLGFEHATFMILEKGKLKPIHQRGYSVPLTFELPLDGTEKAITVRAAVTREPILVSDTRKCGDCADAAGFPSERSALAVPVMVENNVLGVLSVESKELNAFDQKDVMLLQILASHAATAISNLKKRDEIEQRINQQASLMKSSAEMIHSMELHHRLQAILDAIHGLGWRRVVLSVREENLDIAKPDDIVTAGLTDKERGFLWTNRQPGKVWAERFGSEYERFRIGEFYYLPWSDPFVREKFTAGTVSSHLKPEEMVDWDPEDLLYAPLRLADGRIVGVVSVDDPVDGRRPTREALAPLELFLHQAAVAIESARLIEQLNDAKRQLQEYAGQLEAKVKDRTRALMEAQNRLLKAERLAAIGELAGMVGHDLRNPLTGIAGAAYYLKTKYSSEIDAKGKEMLKVIEKDIEYSNKIINDLLEYSREIKLKLTETDPKSLLREALSYIRVPANVKVLDETRKKPKVKVDVEKMRRVLINVMKNAFDAMPKGGKLTVRSEETGDGVHISFSDTGMGMSEETMSRLWTPLFTTKAKGMGFGLPICKRIVESHGGRVAVESMVGEGTTFTIHLLTDSKTKEAKEKIWVNVPEPSLSNMDKQEQRN